MKIIKPPFTQVVAGVVKSGDPSVGVNPTVQGQLRTTQWIMDGANKNPKSFPTNASHFTGFNTNGHVVGGFNPSVATLEFDPLTFNELFELHIGSHVLKAGNSLTYTSSAVIVGDFLNNVGILIADMLDNLVDAINRIPEFSATNDGAAIITIEHKAQVGINSDSLAISYRNIDPTVTTSPFVEIIGFDGGSPTVGSVLIN